jgi:hypothetical protein
MKDRFVALFVLVVELSRIGLEYAWILLRALWKIGERR